MENNTTIVSEGSLDRVDEVFRSLWDDRAPLVIADSNTWKAAGAQVFKTLKESFGDRCSRFIFPDNPKVYADYDNVTTVRQVLEEHPESIAVAVGSGTINDLVKRASFEVGRGYMVVPTACSMDGYTAKGASISRDGFKQTMDCPVPKAMVADPLVFRHAPAAMSASGYGDLAAKVPAGADWLIADRLGIEPIHDEAWHLAQDGLKEVLADARLLVDPGSGYIDRVFLKLVDLGQAMAVYKDTRPASGADHLMSHVWEMEHLFYQGIEPSHGFKVSIGTLVSTALMTEFLKVDIVQGKEKVARFPGLAWKDRLAQVKALLSSTPTPPPVFETTVKTYKVKYLEPPALKARQKIILEKWNDIQGALADQLIPFDTLKGLLGVAGCPTEPGHIGLSGQRLELGIRKALLIRNRYTILDFLYEAGLFEDLVTQVVYGGEYFSI
ncbi:MAG: sn-glycerol-1-phosphate dehydrogenase [Spirochaetales bacterium]|nr:sn-glycerol-1-phosphate dehydrogenase [Spirochaetales bacterium]